MDRALHVDVEQGTPEWHRARLCRITSSRFGRILKYAVSEEEKFREARIICGVENEEHSSEALDRMRVGSEYESVVRDWYAEHTQQTIRETGSWIYRDNPVFSGSLDGLMENGDLLEIKIIERDVPTTYDDSFSEIPISHYWQMQGNMFIIGSLNCHYVVFSRLSKRVYTRTVPFNRERFMRDVYEPALEYYRDYLEPTIRDYRLKTPYEDYDERVRNCLEK